MSKCCSACRGDLLPPETSTRLQVTSVTCPFAAPRERAVPASDALSSVHREHVHGSAAGRFALQRALAARMQRGALAASSAQLRLWAAQAGVEVATGVPVDEEALECMSGAQLEGLLLAEELRLLHAHTAAAD